MTPDYPSRREGLLDLGRLRSYDESWMQQYLAEIEAEPLKVGRKLDTEYKVELISPGSGTVLTLVVLGSRQSAANLAALAYAREDGDQSWRTKDILSGPPSDMSMTDEEMAAEIEREWDEVCICGDCDDCDAFLEQG